MKRQRLQYKPIDGTLALLDGDIIVWRIGATTQDVDEKIALSRINSYLDNILFDSGASDYLVFLTGGNNYRKVIYPEYKANRTQDKPKHYELIREYLMNHEAAVMCEDEEADDVMGYSQTEHTIICSIDKDLDQIPGRHFNFVKNKHYYVTEDEGRSFFWRQILMGDRVDNIPGLPKVGQRTAEKILEGCSNEEEYFKRVFEAYTKYLPNLSAEEILERIQLIGRLVYIRRKPEELWEIIWRR